MAYSTVASGYGSSKGPWLLLLLAIAGAGFWMSLPSLRLMADKLIPQISQAGGSVESPVQNYVPPVTSDGVGVGNSSESTDSSGLSDASTEGTGLLANGKKVNPIPYEFQGPWAFTDVGVSGGATPSLASKQKLVLQMISKTAAKKFDVKTIGYCQTRSVEAESSMYRIAKNGDWFFPEVAEIKGSQVILYLPRATGEVVVCYPFASVWSESNLYYLIQF